jgi:hypothetical protein
MSLFLATNLMGREIVFCLRAPVDDATVDAEGGRDWCIRCKSSVRGRDILMMMMKDLELRRDIITLLAFFSVKSVKRHKHQRVLRALRASKVSPVSPASTAFKRPGVPSVPNVPSVLLVTTTDGTFNSSYQSRPSSCHT